MYLISQLWWFLLLAFLLGALVGYLVWRSCGRRNLQASYERQTKDLGRSIVALEHERDRFSATAVEAEQEVARLKEALQGVAKTGKPGPSREART